MKKKIWLLCALPMLTLAACGDKENEGGAPSQELTPTHDGIYTPTAHIAEVKNHGETTEVWNWQEELLTSVCPVQDGQADPEQATQFEYVERRVVSATSSEQRIEYTYTAGRMSQIRIIKQGEEMVSAVPEHTASGIITKMRMTVNREMVNAALAEVLSGLGQQTETEAVGKDGVENVEAEVLLTWRDGNVVQTVTNAAIDVAMPMDKLLQMPFMDSLANSRPEIIAALQFLGQAPITLTLNIADTTQYTYDQAENPYYGYPGGLEYTNFSKANVLTMQRHGMARAALPETIGAALSTAIPDIESRLSRELPSSSASYSYTYNENNYPSSKTTEEDEFEYIYAE